jgi:hypothetical protein
VKFRFAIGLALALTAMLAHAQQAAVPLHGVSGNTTVLPVLNNENGQVEALLLIEPSALPQLPSQRIISPAPSGAFGPKLMFGNGLQLRAGLTMDANPGIGVLCDRSYGVMATVGSLAGHCLLADFNSKPNPLITGRPAVGGLLQLQRDNMALTAGLGLRRDVLDDPINLAGHVSADRRLLNSLLGPGSAAVDQQDASLVGQISLGSQGWISIGGTAARVRLITAAQLPGGLPPEWNTGSLSLGAGVGNFSGEITGEMINIPGQLKTYSTLGAGVTWRTPWRAKLSVGADNLIKRGKNPFGLPDANNSDEGTVPYVRYQQDL